MRCGTQKNLDISVTEKEAQLPVGGAVPSRVSGDRTPTSPGTPHMHSTNYTGSAIEVALFGFLVSE